ncbi:CNBP [Mytilus edulis]|uniref:CCHC-type domain-containing protein n=2 Tax=Mytilus TaxID=6548 RepID=A0A8B6EQ92_MYTGA|nr:CNBP [Mytilus edulis]VDI38194.1 Hypothetical predicted protein [Mytilus galloprovincialis]VDI76276.1 Hypothetical predicted protein [Mytilus galloprovincialis]
MAVDAHKAQIKRHLSIHFGISFTKGITHTDVLNELKTLVDQNEIQTIQITEKECIVTVHDQNTKHTLLTRGINLKNRYIRMVDVEQQVTNVTIKDAPCEMSDVTICGHLSKFGDVVQGSLRRGLIKDTNIETGTRYVQLTNCIPIIPTATKFGRFSVRMFADNNRTECPYCTRTDHPSYRCTNKPSRQNQAARKCYRCNSTTHTIKDCPHSEKLCYRCGKEGHIQRDCQTDDQEMYGDYVHDIQEGRDANKNDSFTEDNNSEELIVELNKTTETVFEQTNATLPTSETVIFGASNCSRIRIEDPSINNIAVSGTTLDQIDKLVCQSDNIVNSDYVANVILSLGTNDISKHRSDTEQITANLTTCIDTLKTKYPNARIGICSILPRRGKGSSIQALNTAARSVNSFTQKLCVKSQVLKYIDLWDEFAPNKTPFRALFDLNDPSGVHISKSGIELMENIFEDFINSKCEGEYETPSKKRNRSSSSTPGSSEKQVTKMPKSC